MIELPPAKLKGYWCPVCGRFELVNQSWHVASGTIGTPCDQREMVAVQYECVIDRTELTP